MQYKIILRLVPGSQCGGCLAGFTKLSVKPCLEKRTYCEAEIEVSQLEERLTEALSTTCKWSDVLLAARRLFEEAGRTFRAASETWQKAKETWVRWNIIERFTPTQFAVDQAREVYQHEKQAWKKAQDTWALARRTWVFARRTADATQELCEKNRKALQALYEATKDWLSRCLE